LSVFVACGVGERFVNVLEALVQEVLKWKERENYKERERIIRRERERQRERIINWAKQQKRPCN
jgi:hypothetical protein